MSNLTNVIVVTINYRFGALGFLWDDSLGLEGNYGYHDQVMAIEWTHRNIGNFGGNPDRIVIFGESAGAHSVYLHLMNKTSVIKGGIAESPTLGLPLRSPESWGTLPTTFSQQMGCNPATMSREQRLRCLRRANVSMIVDIQTSSNNDDPQSGWTAIKKGMPWTPTVGRGSVIPKQPLFAFQSGDYNVDIPLMTGTNTGEGFLFDLPFVDYESVQSRLQDIFGVDDASKVMAFYNISNEGSLHNLYRVFGDIRTDWWFRCPTRNVMASMDNMGYFYHFGYIESFVKHLFYWKPECWTECCHEQELPAVFNPDLSPINIQMTEQEVLGSNQIQFMWSNFAWTGDPAEGPHAHKLWAKWTDFGSDSSESQRTLMINGMKPGGFAMVNAPDAVACTFWDELGYKWFNNTQK